MLRDSSILQGLRQYQEFLNRSTAPAHWWASPNDNVLAGRDLQRKEQGTWLGITKQGRIAILTNFREEGAIKFGARSRGAMVNAFLTQASHSSENTERFIEKLVEGDGLKGVGGFSLVCGKIGEPLAVISNRTPSVQGITWVAKDSDQTIGLSNAAFADKSWPKVSRGEELLAAAVKNSVVQRSSKASFIEDMFNLLSHDTLPRKSKDCPWDTHVKTLRQSIFIPAIGGESAVESRAEDLAAAKSDQRVEIEEQTKEAQKRNGLSGLYGTQKQTVILVDRHGRVTFVERTLYDATARAIATADRERMFEFDMEGWMSH